VKADKTFVPDDEKDAVVEAVTEDQGWGFLEELRLAAAASVPVIIILVAFWYTYHQKHKQIEAYTAEFQDSIMAIHDNVSDLHGNVTDIHLMTFYDEEEQQKPKAKKDFKVEEEEKLIQDPPAALPGAANEKDEKALRMSLKDVSLKVATLNKLRQEKGLPVRKEKDKYAKTRQSAAFR
jgi:hypothetical protein